MNRNDWPWASATALGFGTAVAMWGVGFLARMPPARVGSAPLLVLLLVVLAAGGVFAGRRPEGGWRLGLLTGGIASLVNLLVLGAVLSDARGASPVPAAAIWVPGSILLGAALGGAGAWLGRRTGAVAAAREPTHLLAIVAAGATLLLVAVGGLVTSHEAGLAVVDWPNSYGSNMFLFPLSRMVGGVFYEHAHRLLGSLVGLVTVVLFLRILRTDPRGGVRALAFGALVLVIAQGVLGGLRVTGHFTWSESAADTRPNLTLALVHGVTGQLFFCWIVLIGAVTSATWRQGRPQASGAPDRRLPLLLVIGLLVQLILGVRVRHLGESAVPHMTLAIVLLILTTAVAIRAHATSGNVRPVRISSRWLLGLASAQVVLGGIALVLVLHDPAAPPSRWEVLVTTLHQTTGALLLGTASIVALWLRRIRPLVEAPEDTVGAAHAQIGG